MAPVAPHGGSGTLPPGVPNQGPVPKPEYANLFNDVTVPRTQNFNPDVVREPLQLLCALLTATAERLKLAVKSA